MGNKKEMEEIFYIYDMILPLSGESGYDSCQGGVYSHPLGSYEFVGW